jgi:Protein of unknown function (DUF3138)
MKHRSMTALIAACSVALPTLALAQTPAELSQQMQRMQEAMAAMQARINQLEAAQKPKDGQQWGMTPDQVKQLNRTTVKTDALEEAQETLGFKGLKISGMIDPTYIHTSNQNRSGFQFLNSARNFEYAFDNGTFGMAILDFQKEMEGGTKWRLRLTPNRGGGGSAIDGESIVHEASMSVPLGDLQTRLIAGQMPDWSGHEFAEPTLNRLITHNLLFDFTIPTVYTGAGVDLNRDPWYVKAVLANFNSSKKRSGEKSPVLAYRVDFYDYKKEFNGWGFAGMHGKVSNFRADDGVGNPVTGLPYDTRDTMVNAFEVDGFYSRGDWTMSGQLGVGSQRKAAITANPVTGELRDSFWWGASAMVSYKFTPRFETIARLDYLHDKKNGGGLLGWVFPDSRNGIGPDPFGDQEIGASRMALSLGTRYIINANTSLKAEYRLDRASLPVFLDLSDGGYKRSNQLFGASVVMSF